MRTTQVVTCTVPGLEAVQVEYDMMASVQDFDDFVRTVGREGADEVIVTIDGWPEKEFPGGPMGDAAPMAWRLWLVRTGLREASQLYVTDPN